MKSAQIAADLGARCRKVNIVIYNTTEPKVLKASISTNLTSTSLLSATSTTGGPGTPTPISSIISKLSSFEGRRSGFSTEPLDTRQASYSGTGPMIALQRLRVEEMRIVPSEHTRPATDKKTGWRVARGLPPRTPLSLQTPLQALPPEINTSCDDRHRTGGFAS